MPAVFVNGNPESAAIWEPLLAELDRTDVLRLSPPGFGAEVPDGFDCTVPAYREWLTAELEALGEPVDLVAMTWAAAQSFPSPWPGPACCGPGPATPWGYSTSSAWPPEASAGRWQRNWLPLRVRTWAGPSSRFTAPPPSRPWPSWVGTSPLRHSGRASPSSGPRTTSWAPRRCAADPRPGQVPALKSSMGSGTGGWCKTQPASRELSAPSGRKTGPRRPPLGRSMAAVPAGCSL